jgi:biopolymer transport protein ExbD
MIDELFIERKQRHGKDLNIVPILDMMTTVIFFLLMSTSFLQYTKLTVPPATASAPPADAATRPLSPRIVLSNGSSKDAHGARLKLALSWEGTSPGKKEEYLDQGDPGQLRPALMRVAGQLSSDFVHEHPGERTIRVGLSGNLAYQDLISIMDGVRPNLPDVVLLSYAEATR